MPAYIRNIWVQQCRCFTEPVSISLEKGGEPVMWTVLLGENGVGKTTLAQLAALAAYSNSGADIAPAGMLLIEHFTGIKSMSGVHQGPTPRRGFSVDISLGEAQFRFGPTNFGHEKLRAGAVPAALAYGAHRVSSAAELGESDPLPIATIFDDDERLINVEEWLLRLKLDAALREDGDDRASRELAAVKDVLPHLLPDVHSVEILRPGPERRPGDLRNLVVFHTPDGVVPFSGLSLGYRTIAATAVDMAARMFRAYPESADPLAEPAICVIDEIDLHLHPRWQREVVGYLRSHFPKTQFVVTTHSPLIVQASGDEANVVVLRRDDSGVVRAENDPASVAGWRVDQILTSELFGVDSPRSSVVAANLARRTSLSRIESRTAVEDAELAQLHGYASALPSQAGQEDQAALDAVRRLTEKLKAQ